MNRVNTFIYNRVNILILNLAKSIKRLKFNLKGILKHLHIRNISRQINNYAYKVKRGD